MKRLEPQQMLGLRVMGKKGLDAYSTMPFRKVLPSWSSTILVAVGILMLRPERVSPIRSRK
jgi:hypothetical protein